MARSVIYNFGAPVLIKSEDSSPNETVLSTSDVEVNVELCNEHLLGANKTNLDPTSQSQHHCPGIKDSSCESVDMCRNKDTNYHSKVNHLEKASIKSEQEQTLDDMSAMHTNQISKASNNVFSLDENLASSNMLFVSPKRQMQDDLSLSGDHEVTNSQIHPKEEFHPFTLQVKQISKEEHETAALTAIAVGNSEGCRVKEDNCIFPVHQLDLGQEQNMIDDVGDAFQTEPTKSVCLNSTHQSSASSSQMKDNNSKNEIRNNSSTCASTSVFKDPTSSLQMKEEFSENYDSVIVTETEVKYSDFFQGEQHTSDFNSKADDGTQEHLLLKQKSEQNNEVTTERGQPHLVSVSILPIKKEPEEHMETVAMAASNEVTNKRGQPYQSYTSILPIKIEPEEGKPEGVQTVEQIDFNNKEREFKHSEGQNTSDCNSKGCSFFEGTQGHLFPQKNTDENDVDSKKMVQSSIPILPIKKEPQEVMELVAMAANNEDTKEMGQANLSSIPRLPIKIQPEDRMEPVTMASKATQVQTVEQIKSENIFQGHPLRPCSVVLRRLDQSQLELSKLSDHCLLIKCKICDRTFRQQKVFETHLKVHDKGYDCYKCYKPFLNNSALQMHVRQFHGSHKPFECEQCGKRFILRGLLRAHAKMHSPKVTCDICGSKVKTLYKHMNVVHGKVKKIECVVCGKYFSRESYLIKHTETVHMKQEQECDICGCFYKNKDSLQRHRNQHTKYKCDLCEKEFSKAKRLTVHKFRIHGVGNMNELECSVCKKKFEERHVLKTHMKSHTDTGERPYACDICKETFPSFRSFNSHKRRHASKK